MVSIFLSLSHAYILSLSRLPSQQKTTIKKKHDNNLVKQIFKVMCVHKFFLQLLKVVCTRSGAETEKQKNGNGKKREEGEERVRGKREGVGGK